MNPFYEFRGFLVNLFTNFFSFLGENSLIVEVSVGMFVLGIVLGLIMSWYKYFWRHFMFRG